MKWYIGKKTINLRRKYYCWLHQTIFLLRVFWIGLMIYFLGWLHRFVYNDLSINRSNVDIPIRYWLQCESVGKGLLLRHLLVAVHSSKSAADDGAIIMLYERLYVLRSYARCVYDKRKTTDSPLNQSRCWYTILEDARMWLEDDRPRSNKCWQFLKINIIRNLHGRSFVLF